MRNKKRRAPTIRVKFIIILLAVTAVVTSAVTAINAVQIQRQTEAYVLDRLRGNANFAIGIIGAVQTYTMWMLDGVASIHQGEGMQQSISTIFTSMNAMHDGMRIYCNILIFDTGLNLVIAANPYCDIVDLSQEVFAENISRAWDGFTHVSPVVRNPVNDRMQFLFTQPMVSDGEITGLAAIVGNAAGIGFFLEDYFGEQHSFVNIAGSGGVIFYSNRPDYIGFTIDDLGVYEAIGEIPFNIMFAHTSAITGIDKIAYIQASDPAGWTVVSFYDADAIENIVVSIALSLTPMIVGMILSATILAFVIRRMLMPLTTLAAAAQEVADGNLDVRFAADRDDEISQVSKSFRMVVDALFTLQKNFKKAESAMARGDILYRLKDESLSGAYSEILENTNSIIRELQIFFELLSEPFVIIDSGQRVRYANKIMREYTKTDEKYVGTFINDFANDDLSSCFKDSFKSGNSLLGVEIQLWLNPSELFDLELNFIPFMVDGQVGGAIIILNNVTQIKEMQRSKIEAESASKAKSDFLSKMSHEIRTPMNSIMGIADVQLLQGGLSQDTAGAFFKIKSSSNVLLSIINDILDLSKVEAGKMEIFDDPYELDSLIFDAVQINTVYMGEKDIDFVLEIADNMPSSLIGDELRIKQIINNLLSNAFKYTKEGEVRLVFDIIKGMGRVSLVIEVHDTGDGMTKEQLEALSGEYVRFNEHSNRKIQGTGLGMNITSHIIQMMHGTFEMESEPGVGSTFRVCIPQEIVGRWTLSSETIENLKNFKASSQDFSKLYGFKYEPMPYGSVLIVDDVESNLEVAKGLMKPYGVNIETASSGYEAVELVKAGNVYDIIFMDHMMPGIDGIEAGKIIMSQGYPKPLVALTANAIIGQAEKFLSSGFVGFLSKPIDVNALNRYMVRFIRDEYPAEVVKAARAETIIAAPEKGEFSPAVIDSFLRDAARAIDVITPLLQNPDWNDSDYKLFTINTHGMKSALANLNKTELSKVAAKLEQAGNVQNDKLIRKETPSFLESLNNVVADLKPEEQHTAAIDEDITLLKDKLQQIKNACEVYNKKDARKALDELNGHLWSKETTELLKNISASILHSEFEEIVRSIDVFF